MEKKGDRLGDGDRDSRGVTPVVGVVLLFALVIAGALLVFLVGSSMIDALESQTHSERTEQTLAQFDSDIATVEARNNTVGSVYLGKQTKNEIVTDGNLTVEVSNGFETKRSDPIELRTIVTRDEKGNEFAYQAGGIWRVDGTRETAVSDPNVRYYTESIDGESVGRVDISPVTVEGDVGTGKHTAKNAGQKSFESFGNDIKYVDHVTVEVANTSYHQGWYNFLKSEFDAVDKSPGSCNNPGNVDENIICHDESAKTVTVVATVDGETPLANLVDIKPTIYGGLYLEGTSDTFDKSLTVTGYDDHRVGTNESNDLFVANYRTYTLHNDADITGTPVVNGKLTSRGNPEISAVSGGTSVGYGGSVDPGPNGKKFDDDDDGYWLDAHKKAPATELSKSYGDIDKIDSKVNEVRNEYLDGRNTASGRVDAGLYDGTGSITTLNSSTGNVHIGATDPELEDVVVKGDNRTSIYASGTIELSNVTIEPDDRANALWIYGTSNSTIEIKDDFQGVIYAPGADIEIDDGVTVDGAIVAGNDAGIEDNVRINFDRSLRTDTPLTDADEQKRFEYSEDGRGISATFVLDRSGSMGPHKNVKDWKWVSGDDWKPIPVDEYFQNEDRGTDVVLRNTSTNETRRLGHRNDADPENWDEIKVPRDDCGGDCAAYITLYTHPGNDPTRERVTATKNFIDLLNESDGDRAGVYTFNHSGHTLHHLDSDLAAAEASVVGRAKGGTNMTGGFDQALEDYKRNGTSDQKRVTVLLSDGKNSKEEYNEKMNELVREANDLNVTLYTVGLTGPRNTDIPDDKLEEWAKRTGGEYYEADRASDLNNVFTTIRKEEIKATTETKVSITVRNDREITSGYAVSVSEQKVKIDD